MGGGSVKKELPPKFPSIIKDETPRSDALEKYIPSREEIKRIAGLVKKITGLEVGDDFEKGMLKIKIVSMAEGARIENRDILAAVKKFDLEPSVMKIVKKSIMDPEYHKSNTNVAFFNTVDDTIYLIRENAEREFKGGWESPFKEDMMMLGHRNRTQRYSLFNDIIHESLHKVEADQNTLLRDRPMQTVVGKAKLISQLSKISENDPKAPAMKREAMEFIDRMRSRYVYSEAFAYYACHKVLCELDYKGPSALYLEEIKLLNPPIAVGVKFLEQVERSGKNPFSYTINHLPLGMRHLEHPDEYLRDREKGKV